MNMVLSRGHGQAIEICPIINYFASSDEPTDNDCTSIRNGLLPILHNIDYNMNSNNNLVGLIKGVAAYTAMWSLAFSRP